MTCSSRLAAHTQFINQTLERRAPFVLLLRSWSNSSFGHVVAGKDVSNSGRWARVAASVLPVFALEQPGTEAIEGIFSPAVPRTGWERTLRKLVRAATRIIVVVDEEFGDGLSLEIEELRNAGRLSDALLLAYGNTVLSSSFRLAAIDLPESDVQADAAVARWLVSGDTAGLAVSEGFAKAGTGVTIAS